MKSIKQTAKRPLRRCGAALVEAAFVIPAFLLLILGMLDFGMVTLNRNNLSAAAIRLCRAAILHGEKSAPERTPWGPAIYQGTAATGDEVANVIKPYLVMMKPSDVQIRVEWPDASNALGKRVQVTVSYEQKLICTGLFGAAPWTQQAVSAMRIQH
ncbi:MAG: pilus assembly protein [Planctomycetaceae bacterium]|nr:pilus assembly protein [Planctomycetaceae bacterium]